MGTRPRWAVVAVAVGIALAALGPFVVTLLRAETYSSETTISLTPSAERAGVDPPNPTNFLREALDLRDLQRAVARKVGWLDAPRELPEHATVSVIRTPDGYEYLVTARAPRAREAHELAEAVAAHLIAAGEHGADFVRPLVLQRTRRALASDRLSDAERHVLRRREEVLARDDVRFFAPVPTPATLADERRVDRVIAALPGRPPLRPNPLWVALAGLALAAALALWAYACGFVLHPRAVRS